MTDTNGSHPHGSLTIAADVVRVIDGAEELPMQRFLKYLTDYDIHPELVAAVVSIYNPELVRARMNELESYGWGESETTDPGELRGVDADYAHYWDQVQQAQRLIVILERDPSDPLALGNYAVRGPAQWLIEAIWQATGVTPINPGNSESEGFVAAWNADHPDDPRPDEPEMPFDFVPIRAGVARTATRREILSALLWPVTRSVRSGVLPALVGVTVLLAALALWLIGAGPFWALLVYALAATILALLGWTALTAWHLGKPGQQVLISASSDAIIGLRIVRDDTPHLEIHAHHAVPVGSGAGLRFRELLLPDVKEFTTTLEPGMPIKTKCPTALWRKLQEEANRSFPQSQGWQVTRAGDVTLIYPPGGLGLESSGAALVL